MMKGNNKFDKAAYNLLVQLGNIKTSIKPTVKSSTKSTLYKFNHLPFQNDEVLMLLDSQPNSNITITSSAGKTNNKGLDKCYSKPNLKPVHKLPAISISKVKSRPTIPKCHKKNNKTFIFEQGLDESKGNLSQIIDSFPILQEPESDDTDPYKASLISKIESALEVADKLAVEELRTKTWEELKVENAVFRNQFKTLNTLLDDLLRCRKYEEYAGEMQVEQAVTQQKADQTRKVTDKKRLNFYKVEYQNLCYRAQNLSDPGYIEGLENNCNELDVEIEQRKKRIQKLHIAKKLGDYKMIKVAGDPKLFDDQKEVGELMEMVDKTKDQINATSERISKHRQAIMHEKEQLENAKEKWNNLVKSGKVMGITPEMLIKQKPNKEKIEEKARCEKALEQLKQQKESLENRFHVRGRDLYKQSKEIQQKIEIAKAEIEQLEKKITFEQNVLEYLAEELNNGREKISRKITREVYKENVVENTPEVLMQELSMKENTASLKIQKAWKRYVNNKKRIKKKSKAEIVPLASRIEPLEVPPQRPAYEQRDCILLFDKKSRKFKKKKKYNPIETFGQSQEAPLMIEQGIQARDENYY